MLQPNHPTKPNVQSFNLLFFFTPITPSPLVSASTPQAFKSNKILFSFCLSHATGLLNHNLTYDNHFPSSAPPTKLSLYKSAPPLLRNHHQYNTYTLPQNSRACKLWQLYAVDGGVKAMAPETWRHGQKHYPARMGEASWHPPLQYSQPLMAIAQGQKRLKKRSGTIICSPRRIRNCRDMPSVFNILRTVLLLILMPVRLTTAAFINFGNCLSPDIINSSPNKTLQFKPLFVWAALNASAGTYNLNVTAYGNVDGIATQQPYPDYRDPQWTNPNDTVGKIPDVFGSGPGALYTTFTTQFNVLDYTPYAPPAARFCNTSSLTPCPLAPVFNFTGNE